MPVEEQSDLTLPPLHQAGGSFPAGDCPSPQLDRDLIELVGGSLAGRTDVEAATVEAWKRWASEEADKLDPILSGQVLTHLRPPRLEG